MSTYEDAVKLLKNPAHWTEGAKILTKLADPRAVIPLLEAYEMPIEGGDKLCLAEALQAIAGQSVLDMLSQAKDENERRAALRLRRLFASRDHLDAIEKGLSDQSPLVRQEASRALLSQPQDERWEHAMAKMLDAEDGESRYRALSGLSKRKSPFARAAVEAAVKKHGNP